MYTKYFQFILLQKNFFSFPYCFYHVVERNNNVWKQQKIKINGFIEKNTRERVSIYNRI